MKTYSAFRCASAHRVLSALLPLVLLATGGCMNYNKWSGAVMEPYERGDIEAAAARVTSKECAEYEAREGNRDRLICLLEHGKVLYDMGRFSESDKVFAEADKLFDHFDQVAETRISQETAAILLDQTMRDYEGTCSDRIMVSTYRALNHLLLQDLDEARVHMRRAADRQKQSLNIHAKYLAKAKKSAQEQFSKYPVQTAHGQPPKAPSADESLATGDIATEFKSLDTYATPEYADYANPLASYISAHLLRDADNSNARVDLVKVSGMEPGNSYVRTELARFEEGNDDESILIVFENGLAPRLQQKKFQIVQPWTGYSAIALPALEVRTPPASTLLIQSGSAATGTLQTERIANINSIVATDFKNRFNLIVWRTIASVAAKEGATYFARQSMGENKNKLPGLGVLFAGSVWKAMTSNADLRTWRSMPAEVQIARCPRPAHGVLTLTLRGRSGAAGATQSVQVPQESSVVLVRSIGGSDMRCHVVTPSPTPVEPVVAATTARDVRKVAAR